MPRPSALTTIALVTLWSYFFLGAFRPIPIIAQSTLNTDPKTENITISATVKDNIPPTTPVLISPTNNSYVTTGYVTFIWQGSTDTNGIKEYELSLDGVIYLPDIPPNDAETSKFILDYDADTGYYTLKVKQLIPDGTHTWKIRANDMLDNGTDSATWSFTVDTQAPSFVLTKIGNASVSISAQDISTIPQNPIELEDNKPKLLGNGEANSAVVLTVTIPDDPTQTFTGTTDINGNWGQQLGILPRDVVITLDFTITDLAGLVSLLNNVQFIIKTATITYPPTSPTPSPSPTVSPSPGVTPSPTPSPPAVPLITIPLTPAIEIAYEIFQEAWERLPAPLKAIIASVPPEIRTYLVSTAINFAPICALLLLALLALLVLLAMISRFGKDLSPHLIWRTLQALHLFPALPTGRHADKPQGLVYDSRTHAGVPFALVEIRNEKEEVVDSVVTDKHGLYRGLILSPGKYQLAVAHPDFRFPTNQLRATYLTLTEFYRGEIFEITNKYQAKNQLLYLIPVDPLDMNSPDVDPLDYKQRHFGLTLYLCSQLICVLFLPLFVVTGILTLIFPTAWNCLVFGGYCWQVASKAIHWFKTPNLTGNTIDDSGQSLANTIIAVIDPAAHQFTALTQTDTDGAFIAYVPTAKLAAKSVTELTADPAGLLLAITKPGFIWVENGSVVTQYTLDLTQEKKHIIVSLRAA